VRRFVVAIILDPQRRMLMGRRNDSDKWTNPAGSCNEGEDAHLAMAREIKEETGLDTKEMKLVHCGMNRRGNLIYLFLCRVTGKIDTSQDPDEECSDWSFENPFAKLSELHVPLEDNHAVAWYSQHLDELNQ
jgi:8-oxo-dGTP pyrophosphatase MutT (NUDIX family)